MNKLLPCPFCGSSAEKTTHILTALPAITCSNNDCPAKPIISGVSYEDASRDWNHRPQYTALEARLKLADKLAEAAKKLLVSTPAIGNKKMDALQDAWIAFRAGAQ